MKILIIPDVHGSYNWKIAKEKINEVDKIVFLGDYFDSWDNKQPDQIENFLSICSFKRNNMGKCILLLGNHDFSYITRTISGKDVSGHQYDWASKISSALSANKDIIDLAYETDGWIFSHAGFSKTAIRSMRKLMQKHHKENINQDFIKKINIIWHNHWLKDFDRKLDWDGTFNGFGDEPRQFCLWIRPFSLLRDSAYPKQVVGHTEICDNAYIAVKKDNNYIVFCDSPSHQVFNIFDTKNPPKAITEFEFIKNSK